MLCNVWMYMCVCVLYHIIYIHMHRITYIHICGYLAHYIIIINVCTMNMCVCVRGFQIYSECVWICISMLHMFPFINVNIAVPKNGLTWILLLVWLGDAYFGTFVGCWKDRCEVPNNPLSWVGELLEETRHFITTVLIKRRICSMSLPEQEHFAHTSPQHEICQSTRALGSQMLQNVSFVELLTCWPIGPVDLFWEDFNIPPLEVLYCIPRAPHQIEVPVAEALSATTQLPDPSNH